MSCDILYCRGNRGTDITQPVSLVISSQVGTSTSPPSGDNPVVLMFQYSTVCGCSV